MKVRDHNMEQNEGRYLRDNHIQTMHEGVIPTGVLLLGGVENDHMFLVDIEVRVSGKGGALVETESPLRDSRVDLRTSCSLDMRGDSDAMRDQTEGLTAVATRATMTTGISVSSGR